MTSTINSANMSIYVYIQQHLIWSNFCHAGVCTFPEFLSVIVIRNKIIFSDTRSKIHNFSKISTWLQNTWKEIEIILFYHHKFIEGSFNRSNIKVLKNSLEFPSYFYSFQIVRPSAWMMLCGKQVISIRFI